MPLSASVRASLFALWSNRATLERVSVARFHKLARELTAIAAHPEVIALATRAAEDEERHAALCASMAKRFEPEGGLAVDRGLLVDSPSVIPAKAGVQSGATGAAPTRAQVLLDVVAVSCLGETFNAAYLAGSLAGARDPATREATHELLRDEVVHARLGWSHLAAEKQRGDVTFLGAELPRLLHEAFGADLGALYDPPEASPEFALLSRASRVAIFRDTLEGVVCAGFEELGIDAAPARAWLERGALAAR